MMLVLVLARIDIFLPINWCGAVYGIRMRKMSLTKFCWAVLTLCQEILVCHCLGNDWACVSGWWAIMLCINHFIYFFIIIVILIFSSFSVLLSCLHANPWKPFTFFQFSLLIHGVRSEQMAVWCRAACGQQQCCQIENCTQLSFSYTTVITGMMWLTDAESFLFFSTASNFYHLWLFAQFHLQQCSATHQEPNPNLEPGAWSCV